MPWILGWPLTIAYAEEYCIKEGLASEKDLEDPQFSWRVLDVAGDHITRRAGMPYLRARACWVGRKLAIVYQLAVDKKAATPAEAKIRKFIPVEPAQELGRLLGATEEPQWYRFHDGWWDPVKQQVKEMDSDPRVWID